MILNESEARAVLETPRADVEIYEGSWSDFKNDPEYSDYGLWFEHFTPDNVPYNQVEKYYKIMSNGNNAIAVLYKDLKNEKFIKHDYKKIMKEALLEDEQLDDTVDVSISSVVSSLIKNLWDQAEAYKGALVMFKDFGITNYDEIISDLQEENYIAIGQLQKIIDDQKPGTQAQIDSGVEEAETVINS